MTHQIIQSFGAAAILLVFAVTCPARTAEKLIAQYIRAVGGAKSLRSISTADYEGTATDSAEGRNGVFTLILESPGRLYREVRLGSERSTEAFNGKSAWREDSAGGLRTLTGSEGARLEETARYRNARFLNLKKSRVRLRLLGQEPVRGRAAWRVEATSAAGLKREVFFDAENHLLVQERIPGTNGPEEEVFFSDYRRTDGVMEPFQIESHRGSENLRITVTHVSHNQTLKKTAFDFPKISPAPLPDIPALLKDVEKNQKTIDALVENYACRKTEEVTEIDDRGQVKEKSAKEFEVFYLGGREVDRLVKKDGRDLSPSEQKKQTEQVEKHVRRYEELMKKKAERQRSGESEAGHSQHQDEPGISVFLRVSRLTNPRRERFRGQDVIVFDFEPNPAYHAKSLVESFLQKLVGAAWVDEQARQVVRLEARLSESMRIGGGLVASIQKGSAFVFEQAKINNEVWLPSYGELHASARWLLVKGMKGNYTAHYTDYKKFRVESVARGATATPVQ